MEDVIVIGAGVAGLTTAYRLLRAGRRVKCLEVRDIAGGCIRTDHSQGYLCERGAQNFLEGANGPVRALAQDLGIAGDIRTARETANYIAWDARLWSIPRQLARILSIKGLCRGLMETAMPRRLPLQEESAAAWARRRFGPEVALRLIDPMVCGVYAGDPERLSAAATLAAGTALERRHRSVILGAFKEKLAKRDVMSFAGGMGLLTQTLARAVGGALSTATEVKRVELAAEGYFRVYVKDVSTGAPCDRLRARQVVVATPAPIAAPLLAHLDASLADALSRIPYAPLASLWLGFAPEAFRVAPPRGYGVMRPHCQGQRNLGCMFCSASFEGAAPAQRVFWRVLFGGRRDAAAIELSDTDLTALALHELGPSLGLKPDARPEFTHIVKQTPGLPQYEIGHLKRVEEIETRSRRLAGLHLTGNAYRGVPVGQVIADANAIADRLLQGAR
jgi:protoporphyrinogen/coproporphyrinogen III oxidase